MIFKLYHLIIVMILFICFESVISQSKRGERRRPAKPKAKPKPRQRGRQPLPEPTAERTNCYFCYIDFRLNPFDVNNLCYNPGYNFTLADSEYLTTCPQPTKFCIVDITRIGGGLAIVDRKCGGSTCNYFCTNKGYGVEVQTCTHCCQGKHVINEEQIEDGIEIPKYKCP